ncbi:hypothetical protein HXX76_001290 [Chlamydomonas incerta]|uniref:Protein kinase domain-containing protein n=1 Tax=Chlamydomonas incerta TaxID=51695 RepID=A0A835WC03_CHLIN|nr:hypothetical protein HXX76_001290 [Chlamydomonas incerta]|eukprot:KAG2444544.1 hypothetical protein HXX76_001290 [Chlamydomonas incerta]
MPWLVMASLLLLLLHGHSNASIRPLPDIALRLGAAAGGSSGSSSSSSPGRGTWRGLLQAAAAADVNASAAAAAAGYPSAGAVLVSTAAQLVAAIANPTVQVAVLAGSVSLTEADWAPVAQPVVEVRRNLTLLGAYTAPAAWPVLDFGYTANVDGVGVVHEAKLRVAAGCALTFRHLVLQNARDQPHFLFMGLDVVAESPSPNSTLASAWPLLVVHEAALWQRSCLPMSTQGGSGRNLARPAFMPGTQDSNKSVPLPPDCVNSSSAPPMLRCWPARGVYMSIGMFATDPDAFTRQTPAGYVLQLYDTTFWCDLLMTDECVASNGGYVGCHYSLYPYSRRAANATATSPAPPPGSGSGSGSGGSSSSVLAPVLGAVLGGVAFLALLGVFVVLTLRRRRGRRHLEAAARHGTDRSGSASDGHDQQLLKEPYARITSATEDYYQHDERAMVPVTPLTPFQSHIPLDVQLGSGGGEVRLLPVVLGKGACGRVVQGVWCGRRVAVKLLHRGLFNAAAAAGGTGGWPGPVYTTASDAAAPAAALPRAGHAANHGQANGEVQQCGGGGGGGSGGGWPTMAVLSCDGPDLGGCSASAQRQQPQQQPHQQQQQRSPNPSPAEPADAALQPGAAAAALLALAAAAGAPAAANRSAPWWDDMDIGAQDTGPQDITTLTQQPATPVLAGVPGSQQGSSAAAAGLAQQAGGSGGAADSRQASAREQQGLLTMLTTATPADMAFHNQQQQQQALGPYGHAVLLAPGGAADAAVDTFAAVASADASEGRGPADDGAAAADAEGEPAQSPRSDDVAAARAVAAAAAAAAPAAVRAPVGTIRPLNLAHIRIGGSSVLDSVSGARASEPGGDQQQGRTPPQLLSDAPSKPLVTTVSSTADTGAAKGPDDASMLGCQRTPTGRLLPAAVQPLSPVPEAGATAEEPLATGCAAVTAAAATAAAATAAAAAPAAAAAAAGVGRGENIDGAEGRLAGGSPACDESHLAEANGSTLDAAGASAAAAWRLQQQMAVRPWTAVTHGGAVRRTMAQEVEVLARLQHANIVQLLAANLNPACPCLVVELMDTSLDKLLHTPAAQPHAAGAAGGGGAAGPPPVAFRYQQPGPLLPLATVLHIALQVARGLAYLHPTIIHRDLKPANVLVSDIGSAAPVVKIADFGLSRLQDTVLITAHVDVGTAPYMAPEALNARNCVITHHSDMYSYGIMLWEMLAGARPWRGLNMLQIAVAVCEKQQRPRLEDLGEARCPQALRALVAQCWDPVPERRPGAAEVAKELALMLLHPQQ